MTGETFGAMLKRLREARTMLAHLQGGNPSSRLIERTLSQNRLADLAGVNAAYINRLERETDTAPSRAVVLAFANALTLDTNETDRLLFLAGVAPETDWQLRAEAAEAKLEMIRQTLAAPAELLLFRRRTG